MTHPDPLHARTTIQVGARTVTVYSIEALERAGLTKLDRLPFTIRVLLENALRHLGRGFVTEDHVKALAAWTPAAAKNEIPFMPARVLLQDFTGVPCVVDLAAMRDAMAQMGGDPAKINPVVPCDLVIDHSVQVDHYGTRRGVQDERRLEFERNTERYQLLGVRAARIRELRVVPPGTGIVHQVNLEHLSPASSCASSSAS